MYNMFWYRVKEDFINKNNTYLLVAHISKINRLIEFSNADVR